MLPELRERIKSLLPARDDGRLVSLDIERKQAGISFDAVQAGWYLRNGFPQIYSILTGGLPAWSGETVTVQSALNHSVVWACNLIISQSVGFVPAMLMRQADGMRRPADDLPLYRLLDLAPSDEITAQEFSEMLTSHCLLNGNGYAQIVRRSGGGTALQLVPLHPELVFPDREKTGQKRLVYVIREQGAADKTYTVEPGKAQDILHLRGLGWNGITGHSVITMGRQSIGSAIATERNLARFWANGGRVPYNLKLAQSFKTDQDFEKFRSDWEAIYSDPHKTPILEPWLTYEKTGLSMSDAQALETRQFTVSEICRWFNVSPHLVQDLSRSTFSNIEQLALDFVKMTLTPWLVRWEQAVWRCVLTPEEKEKGYFLRHDVDELLRGDFITRMQGFASALQNGWISQDEVRGKEHMDPLPDGAGSHYHIQLNMQTLTPDGATAKATGASAGLVRLA